MGAVPLRGAAPLRGAEASRHPDDAARSNQSQVLGFILSALEILWSRLQGAGEAPDLRRLVSPYQGYPRCAFGVTSAALTARTLELRGERPRAKGAVPCVPGEAPSFGGSDLPGSVLRVSLP